MTLDSKLLLEGGPTWAQVIDDILRRADVPRVKYKADEDEGFRQLRNRGFIAEVRIVDPDRTAFVASNAGTRWEGFFGLLKNSEGRQQILVIDNPAYFPTINKQSLLKTSVLWPVKRWETEPPAVNLPLQDAYEGARKQADIRTIRLAEDLPIGFDVKGVRASNAFGVWTPFDGIRAESLYANNGVRANIKIAGHIGKEDYQDALERGILFNAKGLPSVSGETDAHTVTVQRAPVFQVNEGITRQTKINSRDMKFKDDCGWSKFDEYRFNRRILPAFGRTERDRDENLQDFHGYLALLSGRDWLSANHPGLDLYIPYPKMSESVTGLVEAAYRRVAVRTITYDKGNTNSPPVISFQMISESVGWMKIFTTMAWIYEASMQKRREKALLKATA